MDKLTCEYIDKKLLSPAYDSTYEKLVWAGKKTKYCLAEIWMEQGEGFYNFKTRPDDVWIVTNSRSGTTVTQEMVWLLQNNLDFETAKKFHLRNRFTIMFKYIKKNTIGFFFKFEIIIMIIF